MLKLRSVSIVEEATGNVNRKGINTHVFFSPFVFACGAQWAARHKFSLYLRRLLLKLLDVPVGQRSSGLIGALEKLQHSLLR
jgi:hypothetical protein